MFYQDKTHTSSDCGQEFVWTAGEQEYYAQKRFANERRRCPDCRRARKAQQGGGYASAGGYSAGGGYERPQRQMYPAVCSNCGKETMVPFQPRGDKPVYCSDCFAERRQTSSYGSGGYGRDRY
ncbi:MAG: CxxC-x17-CxxC domain-containing protein [Thermomicrobiales bacterium]